MSRIDDYKAVLCAWQYARDQTPNNALSEEQESDWTEKADAVWREMTPEERDAVEGPVS